MRDMQSSLEKLRTDAAEAALIRVLATDRRKRELFTKLAETLRNARRNGSGRDCDPGSRK